MKQIADRNSIPYKHNNLEDLIRGHLSLLDKSNNNFGKKKLEICHAGSFLVLLNSDLIIDKVGEQPDFILKNSKNEYIGLEHEILVDPFYKRIEGSFGDLIKDVEIVFQRLYPDEKFLLHVFGKYNVDFSKAEKHLIIEKLVSIIEDFVYRNTFEENDFIERLALGKSSRLIFSPNLGLYVQMNLYGDILVKSIEKKNKKLLNYISNSGINRHWLLIVIGSLGHSSFELPSIDNIGFEIQSGFDKIYLLEDYNSNLYELK